MQAAERSVVLVKKCVLRVQVTGTEVEPGREWTIPDVYEQL